eukprot:gene14626-biopygen4505
MDGRSARLDGALPRPEIGLRPSIVHPLRPFQNGRSHPNTAPSKSVPSKSTLRPSNGRSVQSQLRQGATSRESTVRPDSTSVRPMDAPSRSAPSKPSLRPSNGRSVQIGSVQVDAPSVQWTLRPNQLRPSRGSVRPSRRSVRPRRSSVRPNHFLAPENSAPSVHRPWTDGALVWTERFGAWELGSVRPSSKALRPSRRSVRPSRRSVRPRTDEATRWTEPIWTERPLDGRSAGLDGRSVDLDGADLDGASIGRTERRLGRTEPRLGRSALDDGRTEPDSQAPKRSVQTSAPS